MSSIPIHPPSFQSHSQQSNNHQFNTSYTQINHNHNNNQHHVHNHHHVHYNNQKIPPTAVPIIIKSKTVNQTTPAMTQPFTHCNKNNIPPLKTHRNHPPPPSIHPHARNNSHRHHPRHHTPHPRHMQRSRNQTYSNFAPQQQHGYGQRVQRQSNNYYTHRPQVSNPTLPPQPQRADSTLAPSSPTNIHFKSSSPTNFIQSQPPPPSTTPTMANDHPFGNVITDGAVKAPSPIGLDTLDTNSSPHNNTPHNISPHNISPHNLSPHVQHAQSTHVRHALMPRTRTHAKSHASVSQYAYLQQHRHSQQQLHHSRKRKHSQCTKLNQHICAPYNNHHRHPTHCQSHSHNHASTHNCSSQPLMRQPPFKKRKITNSNNQNAANTPNQAFMPHPLRHSCNRNKSRHDPMAPLRKHMHAPHCVRVHRPHNKAAVPPPAAPFANTNISPPKPPTPNHPKSKKQLQSHTRNTYKPHSKQFVRPFPALTEQRYTVDDGTESTNTHLSTHSLPNFKFTSRTRMASTISPKARAAASTHPLSAGQIVPALMSMPMPSVADSHRNRSQMLMNNSGDSDTAPSNTSMPTHTQYPLYPQGPMMVPSRTGSVGMSSHRLPSPNTFNPMRTNLSPNPSPACISPYVYDNEYARDVTANVSEIPKCRDSPFIISDGTNYSENAHDKLTHFQPTPNNDDISEQSVDEAGNSVDVFDDMDGYDAYNENRRKLCRKLGIEDMADFDGNLPPFPITFAELNCHNDGNHNNHNNNNISYNELSPDKELKKAALFALYDVDDLELRRPEVTTLRLSPNEDIMSLCSGSLMGGSHNKSCHRPQKSYVTVNDYNLTYSMAKRGANHEMYKIKMPAVCQQALQEKLAAEYHEMDKLSAYKIPQIAPDALSAAIKRSQPENEAIGGGDDEALSTASTDSETDGVVTDLKEIVSLGVSVPSYCLNPNDYTRKQLRDPGCFKETQFVANPNAKSKHRELEIHFFIYVPGADFGGEIKTKCSTYSPLIYEITSHGKRRCALCGTDNCDCTGIIDLLHDDNERIWACNKCKHAFRVGLKKNTRLKQYRVKDVGCSDDDGGDADYDVLQEKAAKKKVKKKPKRVSKETKRDNVEKKKNGPFCAVNVAFSPYVYRPRGEAKGVYIMRRFERRDLDILHNLDIKMTAQLLGDEAECYGKGWLHKLTNPARTTHHIWRTIACCELLEVGEAGKEEKCHEIVGADGECERRMESQPVAFAMYKHIKNENIGKRYGELFWILVDDKHQRRGIASRLIDVMVNEAGREENISQFRLHVLKENYAAIALYKRLAFYKKGVKPNYPKRNFESYRCVKML